MRVTKEPEVRKAEIIDAAIKLFYEKGYLKTSMQDIANNLSISKGLLYYYYKSKEEILLEGMREKSAEILEKINKIAYKEDLSAVEKLKSIFKLSVSVDFSSKFEMEIYDELIKIENYHITLILHRTNAEMISKPFAHVLEQGNKEGICNVKYPYETSILLFSATFMLNDPSIVVMEENSIKKYLEVFFTMVKRTINLKEDIELFCQ